MPSTGSLVSKAADARTGLPVSAFQSNLRPRFVVSQSCQKSRLPALPVGFTCGNEPVDRSRWSYSQDRRRRIRLSGDCWCRRMAGPPPGSQSQDSSQPKAFHSEKTSDSATSSWATDGSRLRGIQSVHAIYRIHFLDIWKKNEIIFNYLLSHLVCDVFK